MAKMMSRGTLGGHEYINRIYKTGFYVGSDSASDPLRLAVTKWGGECRAEIDIVSNGVIWKNGDPHLKLTLAVDLFEGDNRRIFR